jgi:purine-binding chemotaxis protein CheW
VKRQYCTFYVGDLFLGIEVERIQEVLQDCDITPVPKAPPEVRGLINLRGQIVTAVDLKTRFGLDPEAGDSRTILVLDSADELRSLVADRSADVVEVQENDFEQPPETLKGEARKLIRGAFKLQKSLLLILDADHVFSFDGEGVETGTS